MKLNFKGKSFRGFSDKSEEKIFVMFHIICYSKIMILVKLYYFLKTLRLHIVLVVCDPHHPPLTTSRRPFNSFNIITRGNPYTFRVPNLPHTPHQPVSTHGITFPPRFGLHPRSSYHPTPFKHDNLRIIFESLNQCLNFHGNVIITSSVI